MDLIEKDAYFECMDDEACKFEDDWDEIYEDMIHFYYLGYDEKSENERLDVEKRIE